MWGEENGLLSLDGLDEQLSALRDVLGDVPKSGAADWPARISPRTEFRAKARASFAQRQLWFLHTIDPACSAYHVPLTFKIRGSLDGRLLGRSLEILAQRHHVLRATFVQDEGVLWQIIPEKSEIPLSTVDLRSYSEASRRDRLREIEKKAFLNPFDLEKGPVLRGTLVRLADSEEIFLLCVHHIVCDAWSGEELCRELGRIYRGLATGDLPSARQGIQYADYAERQQERWAAGDFSHQLAYWKQRLSGLSLVSLPAAGERPATPTMRGDKVPFRIPPETTQALRTLCHEEQATLFMGLLTVFLSLISRHTGETDLAVGSGIADREAPESRDVIGYFLNMLVLRTDLSGDPSFREALRRVRKTALEAYEHPDVPFEKLVEALHPARVPGRNPLFGISFTLNEHVGYETAVPGALLTTTDPNQTDLGRAKFDLTAHLWAEGEGLAGVFEYSRDLFERAPMERIVRQFVRLTTEITRAPHTLLGDLPLLDALDEALLTRWNDTEIPWDQTPLLDRFAEHARRSPTSVAVVDENGTTSYAALGDRSSQLATLLERYGVTRETPVGVCTGRSLALALGFLGTLKARGSFLPLDTRQPVERLRQIIAEAEPPVILTDRTHRELAAQLDRPVIVVDDSTEQAKSLFPFPAKPAEAGDLAYLIYTSGSTGRPKGIAVEHRSFAHLIDYTIRRHGIGASDRAGMLTSIGFDPAVWELGTFLSSGATLVMATEEIRLSPKAMQSWILDQALTVLYLAAPLLDSLLDLPWPEKSSLRLVFTGGDRLRATPGKNIPFPIINLYGPAECTVNSTEGEIERGKTGDHTSNIGRPIANVRAHILDDKRRKLPPGIVGEIYLEGVGIARGYHRNPEATAATFLPNPFSRQDGSRLYRTGDLARWRDDGTLHFVGRADGQVKVRGMRIEVGEVEAVLRRHPLVEAAVVVPFKGAAHGTDLGGYYLSKTGPLPDLKAFLRERLPEAMVPRGLIHLRAFPLTPNGKIDVRALPGLEQLATDATVTGPLAEGWETRIAAIWKEVLGLDQVGPETNFFDAGGHSLQLAAVQAKLAAIPGTTVRMLDLFRHTTVRGLATFLTGGATDEAARVPVESRNRGDARREKLARLKGRNR